MAKYTNDKILKLYNQKSKLISQLNKIKRTINPNLTETQVAIASLKSAIHNTTYLISKEFSISANRFWANKAKDVNYRNPESFFPEINRMFRPKNLDKLKLIKLKRNNTDCINNINLNTDTLAHDDDSYLLTDETSMLNVIGNHFEKINAKKTDLTNNRLTELVENEYQTLVNEIDNDRRRKQTLTVFSETNSATSPITPNTSTLNCFFSVKHTQLILKNLKNKTSAGIDNIPNVVLKHLPPEYISYYTILFNNIINNNHFPSRWTTAKILLILKKGKDPTDPSSYRPISLLPNISKVPKVPNQQFGFRFKHSTVHAINKFLTDTTQQLNNHGMVAAGLIDLEKAFDSVWLKGLSYKMSKKGFPRYLIKLIWASMQNRKFITVSNTAQSSVQFSIEEGLQQGTVNSPCFFNIYNADILNLFDLNKNNTYSIAFADDLLVYCTGKRPSCLQKNLENIVNKINK